VLFVQTAAAGQPAQVEVSLFQARGPLRQVLIDGPVELISPEHRKVDAGSFLIYANGRQVRIRAWGKRGFPPAEVLAAPRVVLNSPRGATTIHTGPGTARSYKGMISIVAGTDGLQFSNRVAFRDYVKSVVGSESTTQFPPEALKAQSVLAQTAMARYKPGDVINDTTEKQAYLGVGSVSEAVAAAVDQTLGEQLVFGGRPATVYFHSTCAGGTSDGEAYFGLKRGSFPYLSSRPCDFCRQSPFWQTKTSKIPQAVFQQYFGKQPVTVLSSDSQRRPLTVEAGGRSLSGYSFWMNMGQKLGWDKVPGTRYAISCSLDFVTLTSTGAGHGVGLCQWGACGLARQGKSYLEILRYYFPGTDVRRQGSQAASDQH
jgi:stage II sporulation protein D